VAFRAEIKQEAVMGSLASMIDFLDDNSNSLKNISEKLGKIQQYFNENFNNVNRIRKEEIKFLQENFFKNRKNLPAEIEKFYEEMLPDQKKKFNSEFEDLKKKMNSISGRLDQADENRIKQITKIKKNNTRLDRKEEKLKVNISELELSIDKYNSRIDEMNTGFGFVSNLLKMRKIQKEKNKLIEKRDDFIDEIEEIREKWQDKYKKLSDEDENVRDLWNDAQTELSITNEKIQELDENRDELIMKASFLDALKMLSGQEKYLNKDLKTDEHKKCKRCKSDNSDNKFFCRYCGERFSDDRKDISGSLIEVGELNTVHENLKSGIRGMVSFLALMKGMSEGLKKFTKSVEEVRDSQDKYSALPKLKIDVPGASKKLSDHIIELDKKIDVDFKNLHPAEFSSDFDRYAKEIFTDKKIEIFFTEMGDELNKTTGEQW